MNASFPQRSTAWPALLLAPLIALGDLSLLYALVAPSCARQDSIVLHTLAALSVALTLGMTVLAWRGWVATADREDGATGVTGSDVHDSRSRARFVALVATLTGALSSLVVLALWIPIWMLSPCW